MVPQWFGNSLCDASILDSLPLCPRVAFRPGSFLQSFTLTRTGTNKMTTERIIRGSNTSSRSMSLDIQQDYAPATASRGFRKSGAEAAKNARPCPYPCYECLKVLANLPNPNEWEMCRFPPSESGPTVQVHRCRSCLLRTGNQCVQVGVRHGPTRCC